MSGRLAGEDQVLPEFADQRPCSAVSADPPELRVPQNTETPPTTGVTEEMVGASGGPAVLNDELCAEGGDVPATLDAVTVHA